MRILDLAELNAQQFITQINGQLAGLAIGHGHVELLGLEPSERRVTPGRMFPVRLGVST